MKRTTTTLILALLTWLPAHAQQAPTLEMIWQDHTFRTESVDDIRFTRDGKHYTKTAQDKQGHKNIIKYAITNGEAVDTLFRGRDLVPEGTESPVAYQNYAFSTDARKVLLATNISRIYRRSRAINNYVWDRRNDTLIEIDPVGKQQNAAFSPDGHKVAYIRDNDLFIKELLTGKTIRVTHDGRKNAIINGATDWVYEEEFAFTRAFAWSPDNQKLAYYKFREEQVREFSMSVYGSLYPRIETFKYPKAGEDNAEVSLHIYNLVTEKTKDVDVGGPPDHYIPRIKWTRNPNKLCIQRLNRLQNELHLILADAGTGKTSTLLKETNPAYIEITDDLTFLKDGKHFIWTSERSGYNHIYLYNMSGKKIRQVTQGRWPVTAFYGVDEKAEVLYFQAAEVSPLERHIYRIGLDGRSKTQLTDQAGIHEASFNEPFTYLIHTWSDANTPPVTVLKNIKFKDIRILADNKALRQKLKDYVVSSKTFFSFKTNDGHTLNGYMIQPPGFKRNRKYPVLMFVYGGPGSQTVKNSWGGAQFMWYQHLAEQGYIIVSVDNRGTGGRGQKFKKVTYLELGKYELLDQIETVKYLGRQSYVDRDRIGIWGWSYGGYLSSLCITKGTDYFKTAVAVAPVTNWRYYDTIYTERFMRTPQENENGYDDNSPLHFAHKLEGHYLLIHGMADDNVHFQHAVEMADALITAKKSFEFVPYPNRNHGIYGQGARIHLYSKITSFILEKL